MMTRLSPSEQSFLAEFSRARANLLGSAVLQHLPAGARNLSAGAGSEGGESTAEASLSDGPELTHYVPIKVTKEILQPSWIDPLLEGQNANEGDSYIVSYESVRESVLKEEVVLR